MARQKINVAQHGSFFEELGRATLTSTGTTLDVTFTPKRYIKIIYSYFASGGSVTTVLRFNADSATNYSTRYSDNGGAESTLASTTSLYPDTGGGTYPVTGEVSVFNVASSEKLVRMFVEGGGTGGAANVPTRRTMIGKWSNTSAQANRVVITATSNSFAVGSEMIILGHD